jgi:hypothetical protein
VIALVYSLLLAAFLTGLAWLVLNLLNTAAVA